MGKGSYYYFVFGDVVAVSFLVFDDDVDQLLLAMLLVNQGPTRCYERGEITHEQLVSASVVAVVPLVLTQKQSRRWLINNTTRGELPPPLSSFHTTQPFYFIAAEEWDFPLRQNSLHVTYFIKKYQIRNKRRGL